MALVQLTTKFTLLMVLVLFAPKIYTNDDEIIIKLASRQFPEWHQLSFTGVIPDPWGNQQIEIKKKNNKISFLTLRNDNFFLQFPVKRLDHIDKPHLRGAFLIYETVDIENEITFTVRLAYGQIDEKLTCEPVDELEYKHLEVFFDINRAGGKPKVKMTSRTIDECGVPTKIN